MSTLKVTVQPIWRSLVRSCHFRDQGYCGGPTCSPLCPLFSTAYIRPMGRLHSKAATVTSITYAGPTIESDDLTDPSIDDIITAFESILYRRIVFYNKRHHFYVRSHSSLLQLMILRTLKPIKPRLGFTCLSFKSALSSLQLRCYFRADFICHIHNLAGWKRRSPFEDFLSQH
jgi:hypothetical protein